MAVTEIVGGDSVKVRHYQCLSSDTKPISTNIAPGSTCSETDTGNKFEYDGNSWVQITSNGAMRVNLRDSSGVEEHASPQTTLFPVYGTETTKAAWPAATTVPYSFTPVDVSDYAQGASITLACLMATGSVTLNVDVGWSNSGLAADIHTTDAAVLAGAATGIGALVTKKDDFMHIIGTQTGTVEDSYIFINGRDRA